jgi:uncharacterized membrane protein YphA (DoxX/SURF4 family)
MQEGIGKIILRIGLALVFLWFGFNQLTNPDYWIGFVPSYIIGLGLTAKTFVIINGTAEIILAILLTIGFYTKIVALLLSLHLFSIALSIGWDPIAVRDFGLACAALSLFFLNQDRFTLDNKFR